MGVLEFMTKNPLLIIFLAWLLISFFSDLAEMFFSWWTGKKRVERKPLLSIKVRRAQERKTSSRQRIQTAVIAINHQARLVRAF